MKEKHVLSKEALKMSKFLKEAQVMWDRLDRNGFIRWCELEQVFVKEIAIAMFNKSKVSK